MSSIGGVNSTSASLYSFLQGLQSRSQQTGSTGAAGGCEQSSAVPSTSLLTAATSSADGTSTAASSETSGTSSADGSGTSVSSLRTIIEQAITAALQSFANGGSTSTTGTTSTGSTTGSTAGGSDGSAAASSSDPTTAAQDLFKAVQTAVDKALQQNGIDPKSLHHGHGGHHDGGGDRDGDHGGSAGGVTSAASTSAAATSSDTSSDTSSTAGTTTTDATTTSGSTSGTTNSQAGALLDQWLTQNNVDPTAFKANFLSTMSGGQNSQGGSVNFSQLFQNFPVGQQLSVLA